MWVLSIQCVQTKSCIQNTQFVSSTQLLAQDHSGHFYVANSITDPVKLLALQGLLACPFLFTFIVLATQFYDSYEERTFITSKAYLRGLIEVNVGDGTWKHPIM